MRKNHSPWIHQLDSEREIHAITSDQSSDVVIVGAGIAGVSTAFFVLTHTQKSVVILEASRLAHGATGHNAGQAVSYFERPLKDMIDEFGPEMVARALYDIEHTWELFDEMYTTAGLDISTSRFQGHLGLQSQEQVLEYVEENSLRVEIGLSPLVLRIARGVFVSELDSYDPSLFSVVEQSELLNDLETDNTGYIAVVSEQKGCLNSALFCQEVMRYLLKTYPERCLLFEQSPVAKIILKPDSVVVDAVYAAVHAHEVVLCTNGFENFTIIDEKGLSINRRFHQSLQGMIGYMSGYLEPLSRPPTAISYLVEMDRNVDDPYYYLTRRSYEHDGEEGSSLISVGGPQLWIDDTFNYSRDMHVPDEPSEEIDTFLRKNYRNYSAQTTDYEFTWHGLMGYTRNTIRLIGRDPAYPHLLYNLGCNGIGILPSIYGGSRISRLIGGEQLDPSIFDVPRE